MSERVTDMPLRVESKEIDDYCLASLLVLKMHSTVSFRSDY